MKRETFLGGAVGTLLAPLIAKLPATRASSPAAVNAWRQGARHPAYPLGEAITSERRELGWSMFRHRHARRYPLLARALRERKPAYSIKIEWLEDVIVPGRGVGRVVRSNLQQIVRVPRNIRGNEAAECARAFHQMCAAVEQSLRYGVRSGLTEGVPNFGLPRYTMGGVRELLGRDERPRDFIALRPLRDPLWRTTTYPGGSVIGEWITEVSLQASSR